MFDSSKAKGSCDLPEADVAAAWVLTRVTDLDLDVTSNQIGEAVSTALSLEQRNFVFQHKPHEQCWGFWRRVGFMLCQRAHSKENPAMSATSGFHVLEIPVQGQPSFQSIDYLPFGTRTLKLRVTAVDPAALRGRKLILRSEHLPKKFGSRQFLLPRAGYNTFPRKLGRRPQPPRGMPAQRRHAGGQNQNSSAGVS